MYMLVKSPFSFIMVFVGFSLFRNLSTNISKPKCHKVTSYKEQNMYQYSKYKLYQIENVTRKSHG